MHIFPALSSQNIQELIQQATYFEPYCSGFHIDIMDGDFVPATMGSATLVNELRTKTTGFIWVHLMAKNPEHYINELELNQNDIVSFHAEAIKPEKYAQLAHELKKKQLRPSLALSPKTPLSVFIQAHIQEPTLFEHVLIMSVEPGKSGQLFLSSTYEKLQELQNFRLSQAQFFTIAIDGGITCSTIHKLVELGVSHAAVGSTILHAQNPIETLKRLSNFDRE